MFVCFFFSEKESFGIDTLLYLTPWFMCLYTGLPTWQTVLRIWDLFFLEGLLIQKKKKSEKIGKNRKT